MWTRVEDARTLALKRQAGVKRVHHQLTAKYPKHLRLDYSWGRDGGLLYFSVGEAF